MSRVQIDARRRGSPWGNKEGDVLTTPYNWEFRARDTLTVSPEGQRADRARILELEKRIAALEKHVEKPEVPPADAVTPAWCDLDCATRGVSSCVCNKNPGTWIWAPHVDEDTTYADDYHRYQHGW